MTLKKHKKAIPKFLWLWFFSLLTIALSWVYFYIVDRNMSIIETLKYSFFDGPVLAYVSSTVAPFIYLMYLQFTEDNPKKGSFFSGLSVFITIFVLLIATILYCIRTDENQDFRKAHQESKRIVEVMTPEELSFFRGKLKNDDVKDLGLSKQNYFALIIYILSLTVFYYSIFREVDDLANPSQSLRDGANKMKDKLDKFASEDGL